MFPDFFARVPLSSGDLRPCLLNVFAKLRIHFLSRFLLRLFRNDSRHRFGVTHHDEMDLLYLRRLEVERKVLAEFPDRNRLRLGHGESGKL